MVSFQRRIVAKFLADHMESELRELRENVGIGTIFALLVRLGKIHPDDLKLVEKEMERELAKQRKRANLPHQWKDVMNAIIEGGPDNA